MPRFDESQASNKLFSTDSNIYSLFNNKAVALYTGFDFYTREINRSTGDFNYQISNIKALSLFSDYVALPPSGHFEVLPKNKSDQQKYNKEIIDLYFYEILVSPVYKGFSCSLDYLDLKLDKSTKRIRSRIHELEEPLKEIFSHMPYYYRGIVKQKQEYERLASGGVLGLNNPETTSIMNSFRQTDFDVGLFFSKDHINSIIQKFSKRKLLHPKLIKLLMEINNIVYLIIQAQSYNAFIASERSEKISIIGKDLFNLTATKVLVAYDPFVLREILRHMSIEEKHLRSLDVELLLRIRDSYVFKNFVKIYHYMALEFQNNISQFINSKKILDSKEIFLNKFIKEYNLSELRLKSLNQEYAPLKTFISFVIEQLISNLSIVLEIKTPSGKHLGDYILEKFDKSSVIISKYTERLKMLGQGWLSDI